MFKNLFSTPKRAILGVICIVAVLMIIATGSVFTIRAIAQSKSISKEQAQKFAFADIGVSPQSAIVSETRFTYKKGHFAYEISFGAEGNSYTYLVDSETGAILDKEMNEGESNGNTTALKENGITEEEAKKIALSDAGVQESALVYIDTELDMDDKIKHYEVDFATNEKEYEYSIAYSDGKILEKSVDSQDDDDIMDSGSVNSGYIGKSKAKQIALSDANVLQSDATFTKVRLDTDDRAYDIEFYTDKYEYEYEINAKSGKIIDKSVEAVSGNNNGNGNGNNNGGQNGNNNNEYIGLSKAKDIALKDAGLSKSEVTFTKAYLDTDDGVKVYEIEFYTSAKEYEYEINAKTGAIIDKSIENHDDDADHDDDNHNGGHGHGNGSNSYIGVDKAKEIAVKHAGFSVSEVTFKKAKLESDCGKYVYEIEFIINGIEYEYEICAKTGDILDYESEHDHD